MTHLSPANIKTLASLKESFRGAFWQKASSRLPGLVDNLQLSGAGEAPLDAVSVICAAYYEMPAQVAAAPSGRHFLGSPLYKVYYKLRQLKLADNKMLGDDKTNFEYALEHPDPSNLYKALKILHKNLGTGQLVYTTAIRRLVTQKINLRYLADTLQAADELDLLKDEEYISSNFNTLVNHQNLLPLLQTLRILKEKLVVTEENKQQLFNILAVGCYPELQWEVPPLKKPQVPWVVRLLENQQGTLVDQLRLRGKSHRSNRQFSYQLSYQVTSR